MTSPTRVDTSLPTEITDLCREKGPLTAAEIRAGLGNIHETTVRNTVTRMARDGEIFERIESPEERGLRLGVEGGGRAGARPSKMYHPDDPVPQRTVREAIPGFLTANPSAHLSSVRNTLTDEEREARLEATLAAVVHVPPGSYMTVNQVTQVTGFSYPVVLKYLKALADWDLVTLTRHEGGWRVAPALAKSAEDARKVGKHVSPSILDGVRDKLAEYGKTATVADLCVLTGWSRGTLQTALRQLKDADRVNSRLATADEKRRRQSGNGQLRVYSVDQEVQALPTKGPKAPPKGEVAVTETVQETAVAEVHQIHGGARVDVKLPESVVAGIEGITQAVRDALYMVARDATLAGAQAVQELEAENHRMRLALANIGQTLNDVSKI